jgi:hypothetical protein
MRALGIAEQNTEETLNDSHKAILTLNIVTICRQPGLQRSIPTKRSFLFYKMMRRVELGTLCISNITRIDTEEVKADQRVPGTWAVIKFSSREKPSMDDICRTKLLYRALP